MTWDIKTVSTQAAQKVTVELGVKCQQVLVKNFGANDIWVGIDPEATKTVEILQKCKEAMSHESEIFTATAAG